MRKRFGGQWQFVLRVHPNVAKQKAYIEDDNVLDLSYYEDMQELLYVADVLITDFSSSIWDFMLTGRPGFLFAEDVEEYLRSPGLYMDISELPFSMSRNNDQLEKNIIEFDEAEYEGKCRDHYGKMGGRETGRATQLICERIKKHCYRKV